MPDVVKIRSLYIGLIVSSSVGIAGWGWQLAVASQVQAEHSKQISDHETRMRLLEADRIQVGRIEEKLDRIGRDIDTIKRER